VLGHVRLIHLIRKWECRKVLFYLFLLFIMKINSIIKCLPVGVSGSLYVDGFCICFRSKSLIAFERQIQRCISSIQSGFQFSKSNTVCMHFTQLNSANADLNLKLLWARTPVVSEFRFQGLLFDKKTHFQYIKYLKDRCMKALNLL